MFEKTVLPNGLRVLSSRMPYTRAVTVTFLTGAGARYETPPEAGVSHYLEHMFFKGTQRRPSAQDISEAIEGVGGVMNGSTNHEETVFWVKVARPHLSLALDVVADMLRNSKIEAQEVEKERQVILEELNSIGDNPNQQAFLLADELLFPGHPLGRDVAGTAESVRGIDREMLLRYVGQQYCPTNTVVSVAGDVGHQEVVSLVEEALGSWQAADPRPWIPFVPTAVPSPVRLEHKKTEQAHLCIALPGLATSHPDRYTLDMLLSILGEGMSSRLFLELRERQGLVYDVSVSSSHYLDCGSIIVYAGTEPRRALRTVRALLHELRRISQEVSPAELHRAREMARGRMLLRMEDSRAVAGFLGFQELLDGAVLTVDDVVAKLEAVTVEEVVRVARELLKPERYRLAVVGPLRSEGRLRALLEAGAGEVLTPSSR